MMFTQNCEAGIEPGIGEFVSVDGVRLHYVSRGAGTPVVLLHGNAGFVYDFAALLDALPAQGFRAIAFDRPGHGYSERPAQEFADVAVQARLLRAALRELQIERPILVGHSWGGALALAYALEYEAEVCGLVLLAPAVYPEKEGTFSAQVVLVGIPLISDLLIKVYEPFIGREIEQRLQAAFAPDEVPANYLQLAKSLWMRPAQIKAIVQDDADYEPSVRAFSPRYSEIKAPTVIMTGDADQLVDPEAHAYPLHRMLPASELIVLPETGHMLPHTRADAVAAAIQSLCTPVCSPVR